MKCNMLYTQDMAHMSIQCCCMLHVAASDFSDTATESSDVRQSNMQMLCNNMHDMQQAVMMVVMTTTRSCK